MPRRPYTWMKEYESFTKIDEGEMTPGCLVVWKPVEAMAQDGTFHSSVWFDTPGRSRLPFAADFSRDCTVGGCWVGVSHAATAGVRLGVRFVGLG